MTIKDEEYKEHFTPHECFWCGEMTYAPFWSCRECYPKKEAAYKKNAEEGNKRDWGELILFVNQELKTDRAAK